MKLTEAAVLTDENVHPHVVAFLRARGFAVYDVKEEGLAGAPDDRLLEEANRQEAFVLTHDSDFGKLVIAGQRPFFGIVYIRPGHFDAQPTCETLAALLDSAPDVTPPFVVVAQRRGERVRIRIRRILQG